MPTSSDYAIAMWLEDTRVFMNTRILIKISADSTVDGRNALENAYAQFDRVMQTYTRFSSTSELAKLNLSDGNFVNVSPEMFTLVKKMLNMAETTDGAYDPTIIDLLEAYGYKKGGDFSELLRTELRHQIKKIVDSRPSFREIELDEVNLRIKLAKGQRLDLGGIGKGYAIDLALDALTPAKNALINAGGDFRAKGQNQDGMPWQIGLADKDNILGKVELTDAALACSGGWANTVLFFHHLIDPKTGEPAAKFRQVYCLQQNATDADLWATALFVGEAVPQSGQWLKVRTDGIVIGNLAYHPS